MSEIVQFVFEPLAPLVDLKDNTGTVQERFQRFHELNPHVYTALKSLALDLKRQGYTRSSIWLLFGILRWMHPELKTQGDPWKLNNDFTVEYVRLLMETEPELEGFFEIRDRKAKQARTRASRRAI